MPASQLLHGFNLLSGVLSDLGSLWFGRLRVIVFTEATFFWRVPVKLLPVQGLNDRKGRKSFYFIGF